jgi:hypothetical protein
MNVRYLTRPDHERFGDGVNRPVGADLDVDIGRLTRA